METTKVKKKILAVDGDFVLLGQIKAMLETAGYDVTTAEERRAAEKLLLGVKPDLAIMELILEEKDGGLVLGYEIRKLYPGTPIIILTSALGKTGLSFDAQNPEARSWVPADKILDKPVRPEQLLEEVRKLLHEP
jgi:DNA-binding response OmpR family regulator